MRHAESTYIPHVQRPPPLPFSPAAGVTLCNALFVCVVQSIAETEAKLRDLTTTHDQLFQISELYDGIDAAHEALNASWGRMANDASTLQDIVGSFSAFGVQLLLGGLSFNIAVAKQSVDKVSTTWALACAHGRSF